MVEHHIVWITSLTVLLFAAGCTHQVDLQPAEPNQAETPRLEAQEPEPDEFEIYVIEPPKVESPKAGPNELELPEIEPPEERLPITEPNEVQYNVVEPNDTELAVGEPNEAEAATAEPNYVEPNDVGPAVLEPNEVEPIATEPNDVEPNKVEAVTIVSFHDKCADILKDFVDGNGMVDYSTLRRKRLMLKELLNEFARLDPNEYNGWPKKDKIASWINAYNIQMLNIIVDNYPIEASRILSFFWGPYDIRHIEGIWTDYKFMVMDEEFTLREFEKRFFRQKFNDPRAFLALTHASLSSPPLCSEPYYGHKLDQQLDDQAKRFLSSPQGFKIDRDEQIVYLSVIFEPKPTWYGNEFIDKFGTDKKFKDQPPATRAVLNFITNYVSQQDVAFLEVENYSVKYMKYDWTLNDSSIHR